MCIKDCTGSLNFEMISRDHVFCGVLIEMSQSVCNTDLFELLKCLFPSGLLLSLYVSILPWMLFQLYSQIHIMEIVYKLSITILEYLKLYESDSGGI